MESSPNIQYLFGNYFSSLAISKKCISFYLFWFIIKLYARVILFERLKKYWQNIEKLSKTVEYQFYKDQKIILDSSFIKKRKKENSIPTFAKVIVALRHGTYKQKKKIAHTVMVAELKKKKRSWKMKIKEWHHENSIKTEVIYIIYYVLYIITSN